MYDVAGTGELTESQLKSFGFDTEKCKICGKEIHFNLNMSRGNYTYKKKNKSGRVDYYCGYTHYNKG
jgi:hypothetical protein